MEGGMVMTNTNAADGGARSVHTLAIDKRRHAAITGVTDVCSFHETEVVLKIDSGVMILTGDSLHIAQAAFGRRAAGSGRPYRRDHL